MNKLVVHHYYFRSAFDLSDNRNHGMPVAVTQATDTEAPAFIFAQPESDVRIPPSPSLQDLWSIRIVIVFNLTPLPSVGRPESYNLMSGDHSFAFVVESDGSLMGTILDRDGNWIGARSVPNLFRMNEWHTAELIYDGVNTLELYFKGVKVAEAYNIHGPVLSVGSDGIKIGDGPHGGSAFTGYIREAKLYKYDPFIDANGLLNHFCKDRKAIDVTVQQLRDSGATAESVREKGREVLRFAIDLMGKVRGGDAAVTVQQRNLSSAAFTSFLRGDKEAYNSAFAQLALLAMERLSKEQIKDINQQKDKIVAELPLALKDLQKLVGALCWDKAMVDPEALINEIKRLESTRRTSIVKGSE